MSSLLSTQDNAVETALSRERRRSLSQEAHAKLAEYLLTDSYIFAKVICKHKDLVPAIHMPLSYLACGLTDRLIETLMMPDLDGYMTRKIRAELWRREIDWKTKEGREALDLLINGTVNRPAVINIRMFRRLFKSSVITHSATLFLGTRDPNETIKITHAVDPKAWEFCDQIGHTIISGTYRDFFPHRCPDDMSKAITMKHITLAGRTISHPQTTIQASGYATREEAAHYSTFITDDLVTDLNSTPEALQGVRLWMKRLTGYYMPTRRIRRIEVGTKHDEDDDDTFLTSGSMARDCLTIRVPIEEYPSKQTNILVRGKPTCPQLFPSEKISIEQSHVLSGEEDEDGYRTWWNQYLLSSTGGSLRLFAPEVVDAREHWWLGPFEHPIEGFRRRGYFLVARYKRDSTGFPVAKIDHEVLDSSGELLPDWYDHAEVISIDPWHEMDRVCLIDPSWAEREHSDNWAVSIVGADSDNVKYQLHTASDTNGIDGWLEALATLDDLWHPRVIGFDGAASQDPFIQNLMRTDSRLRRLASRMVKVPHNQKSKPVRMQEGIAEPLNCYRFLLAPPVRGEDGEDRFGGNITREELKAIKSTPKHPVRTDTDGIADSLAMSAAVIRAARKEHIASHPHGAPPIDPILGVPMIH